MNSFKQNYVTILISVKFLGIWWEFWSERIMIGDDPNGFFRYVRDKYRKKFKKFRMRLYYPDDYYEVTNDNVKHLF